MAILILGLVLFLGVHSVSIVNHGWRDRMKARMGEGAWKGLYSLVAAVGLGLIVWGYGLARQQPVLLYMPPVGLRHLTLLLMLPVFPMLLAAYLPGRIQSTLKHPMLLGVKLWAVAHLLANGMLADVLLFGGFLAWAVADLISVKRRPVPAAAPSLPKRAYNDLIVIVAGLAIYVAFLFGGHQWLTGMPLLPR